MITAKIIKDSVSQTGKRITTWELEYPRFIHCFDEDTEILSIDSLKENDFPVFRKFKDINNSPSHLVAQVHPDTHNIEFVRPNAWIKNYVEENLVEVDYQRLNFKVTKGHRIYVGSRKGNNNWKKEIIIADDLLRQHTTKKFFKTGTLIDESRHIISPELAKLVAYFVSDGTLPKYGKQCIFRFSKERKIKEVCRLLDALSITYHRRDYCDGTTDIVFVRLDWMNECYTENGEKRLPNFVWNMDKISFTQFYNGLLESDGNVKNKEYNNYSELLIDQLQSLCSINGVSFNKNKYGECFKVKFLTEDTPTFRKDKQKAKETFYKGFVYCVNVPTGLILVRRNGITHISGNCEFMTHRVFSRNAASSRAIPLSKMISLVWNNPAMPIHWGKNQSGMQAKEELSGLRLSLTKLLWNLSGKVMCGFAWFMNKLNVHKQIANRILEPWSHIKVVMTSTEMDNFFSLRNHPDAQPEIHELARQMWCLFKYNKPDELKTGEWHLPYVEGYNIVDIPFDGHDISLDDALKLSASLCAQVSFRKADESLSKALAIYDRLVTSKPCHASPFEHQAMALEDASTRSGNFNGWKQHREMITDNVCRIYNGD